jgi:hypothetical protein
MYSIHSSGTLHQTSPGPLVSPCTTPDETSPLPSTVGFGYLGATSYSSVFEETTRELDNFNHDDVASLGLSNAQNDPRELAIPLPQRAMCLTILRRLPAWSNQANLFRQMYLHCEGTLWIRLAVLRILESFNTIYRKFLLDLTDEARLMELATIISHNTAKPFQRDIRDPEKWMDQFLGTNLRWEAVGLIFTFRELENHKLTDTHSIQNSMSRVYLNYCIDLSRLLSEGNEVLLYLYYKRVAIESTALGDASEHFSAYHGGSAS